MTVVLWLRVFLAVAVMGVRAASFSATVAARGVKLADGDGPVHEGDSIQSTLTVNFVDPRGHGYTFGRDVSACRPLAWNTQLTSSWRGLR